MSVDPFHSGGLYVNMHKGGNGPHYPTDGLYRTTDCGATWLPRLNTGTDGETAAWGPWTSWIVDPVEEGVFYVAQIYGTGGIWRSRNGGVDWKQVLPTGIVDQNSHMDSISIDPNDHFHLVVGAHAGCAAPYGPACEAETTDGGETWKFVKLPISSGFEEGAGPWVLDATSWLYSGGSGLFLTTDHGATWSDVTPSGAHYYMGGEEEIHPIVRTPGGTYLLTSTSGIVKSDNGRSWSLIANSGGRTVGLVMGGASLFSSDWWSPILNTAKVSDLGTWSPLPSPPLSGAGFAYVDYDVDHHVLYGSADKTLWRMVIK
jgi:hypothetical protein